MENRIIRNRINGELSVYCILKKTPLRKKNVQFTDIVHCAEQSPNVNFCLLTFWHYFVNFQLPFGSHRPIQNWSKKEWNGWTYCTILLVNGNLSHTEINSNDRKHLALEYVQVLQANTITIRGGSTFLTQVESTL